MGERQWIIPVTGRSLSKVRRACWQLSLRSKNYTFSYMVAEQNWHKANQVAA